MFSRYLLTCITAFSVITPAFCMQKNQKKVLETYSSGNNESTTVEMFDKPDIFNAKIINDSRSKKNLTAFMGEDIREIQNDNKFASNALDELLKARLVKVRVQTPKKSDAFLTIDIRPLGNFLYNNDPAVRVLKKVVLANHDYISKKQINSAESCTIKTVPPFAPEPLTKNSVYEKVQGNIYNKNPNVQAAELILIMEDFAFSKYNPIELKSFNSIKDALLSLQIIKFKENTDPLFDLSNLRTILLRSNPLVKRLHTIQDLQEEIIKNSDHLDTQKITDYYSLVRPFLSENKSIAAPTTSIPAHESSKFDEPKIEDAQEANIPPEVEIIKPSSDQESVANFLSYKEIITNKLNRLTVDIPKKAISLPTSIPAAPIAIPNAVTLQTENAVLPAQISQAQDGVRKYAHLWDDLEFKTVLTASIAASAFALYKSTNDLKALYNSFASYFRSKF